MRRFSPPNSLTMQQQLTRDNHYVPQWYQRGFLAKGQHKLHVLNLHPAAKSLPTGKTLVDPVIEQLGPKLAFMERDLYTTRFGLVLNDEIETFLFGKIDKRGADAVRGWIAGDPIRIHRGFQDFFEYMDTQRLRTPKGLDWILKHYQGLPHTALMVEMQALRQMHCTMWSECVREIVSAADSAVKFLVTDHPVTVYNPKLSPDVPECQYPGDPGIELVGSQTLFALDQNHCLVLTNLEYAEDPVGATHLARRTNARFRGESLARTDALVRGRKLSEAEVHAVNLVLKSRARKYVAAGNPGWLHPEQHCALSWEDTGKVLLPQKDLWQFGGEIYIGYRDGTSAYRDKFGRSSKAHEFLTKPSPKEDLAPDAQCGCGGGIAFRYCCADVAPRMRPSWRVMSIRERNLALIRGINRILQIDHQTTWLDVRRNLSDDRVRSVHEVFAALWPTDTRLIDLLPSPQSKRSRALFLGMTDARTLSAKVIGMLQYVDELVVVHPFINVNAVRQEFSPIRHPAKFRDQALRNIFVLLVLEPFIRTGRVHLVPDPLDYDTGFRDEIMAIAKQFDKEVELGPMDKAHSEEIGRDEMMRFIKRLPPPDMKSYIRGILAKHAEEMTDAVIDSVVRLWKKEAEEDPLTALDPPASSAEGGAFKIMKSFARETGLYVATLTGAFVYTDSDTQWSRLHETDGVHSYEPDSAAERAVRCLEGLSIKVPTRLVHQPPVEPSGRAHALIREIVFALRTGAAIEIDASASRDAAQAPEDDGLMTTVGLRASVPLGGFQRTDVSRLVLTFGRLEDVAPVRLALLLESAPVQASSNLTPPG